MPIQRIDQFSVVESGAAVLGPQNEVVISLSLPGGVFDLELKFVSTPNAPGAFKVIAGPRPSYGIIELTNIGENPLGQGPLNPVHFANNGGRKIFFDCRVYKLNDKSNRHIIYTVTWEN